MTSIVALPTKPPKIKAGVAVCALSPQQEKMWSDTRVALLWTCPAFSHILYTMLDNANSKYVALFTKDVPIAATDGSNLLLNPDTFFKYNLNERVFICAHEIMHCIWDHIGQMHRFQRTGKIIYQDGSSLPWDAEYMNIATDLVINDCLIESKVGLFNKDWLHDTSIATGTDSAIDAYKKVYKKKPGGGGGGGGKGKGPKGIRFDEHLPPGTSQGKDPGDAAADRNDVEWTTQVAAAANAARLQGRLPAALDRLLGELLEPKVDWKDQIPAFFARKVGSGAYDWKRPDRRLIVRDIYAPGRSGYGAGCVVIAVDTSGSIGQAELNMFFAEMSGILSDVRPKRLIVMWCDAKVQRVDEVEDAGDLMALKQKGAVGGGGTAFEPVFKEINEMGLEPDALVYLTDGYGSFPPKAPDYPVLWGNITAPEVSVKYPWGDVINIPHQVA